MPVFNGILFKTTAALFRTTVCFYFLPKMNELVFTIPFCCCTSKTNL